MTDPDRPSPDWELGYAEAWQIITRHNEGDDERALAKLLRVSMTTDDGIGTEWVRDDDAVWDDTAREILMAGWFRTECCRFCTPSARGHETDEGHTNGESCCLYRPVPTAPAGGVS